MSQFILPLITSTVVFALYMALAFFLLRKYKSTGDAGFIWLGVAVILWPFLSSLLGWAGHRAMDHLVSHHTVPKSSGPLADSYVPMIFGFLGQAIGLGLLFYAVHLIAHGREKTGTV